MHDVMQHIHTPTADILLTPAAQEYLIASLDTQGHRGVRLSVKKNGCSGLSYEMTYVDTALEGDIPMPLADKYQIYVDKNSYPYLKGMQIDYVRQGLNHKVVFTNPNQTGQCGCGESFTVG